MKNAIKSNIRCKLVSTNIFRQTIDLTVLSIKKRRLHLKSNIGRFPPGTRFLVSEHQLTKFLMINHDKLKVSKEHRC